MKQTYLLIVGTLSASWFSCLAGAQGDWAVYDTFTRYSPAVYSISVEIPKQYILDRHEQLIQQFQDLQENYSDLVTGTSEALSGHYMFGNIVRQLRTKLDYMRDQMLVNNRIRCAGFAIGPHHLVTISTIVKSATLGGVITIKDDYRWVANAEFVGSDDLTGVAVLQVNEVTFPYYVDLSDYLSREGTLNSYSNPNAHPLPVASYIMTIQRPYDLPSSPFSGIIGGYNRGVGLFEIEKYIQTNLPLHPGNEGSPVFSPSGQLIGMMATEFHVGNWPGVTFVIPADIVADSAAGILETGKRERGWISGVGLGQDGEGIVVEEVIPQSPAAFAGLMKGDLILGFNGIREKKVWNLIDYISKSKPNEIIRFEIKRGSEWLYIDIKTSLRRVRR